MVFLKNGRYNFSQPIFVHVAFVSILVFQTFDQIIFGSRLSFPGTKWYVVIVWDPQMVRDQKKFGNHCNKAFAHRRAETLHTLHAMLS